MSKYSFQSTVLEIPIVKELEPLLKGMDGLITGAKTITDAVNAQTQIIGALLKVKEPTNPQEIAVKIFRDSLHALVNDLEDGLVCVTHLYPTAPWHILKFNVWLSTIVESLQMRDDYNVGTGYVTALYVFTAETSEEILTIYKAIQQIFGLVTYLPPIRTDTRNQSHDRRRKCAEVSMTDLFPPLSNVVDVLDRGADLVDGATSAMSQLTSTISQKSNILSALLTQIQTALKALENIGGVEGKSILLSGLTTDDDLYASIRTAENAPEATVYACGSAFIVQSSSAALIEAIL